MDPRPTPPQSKLPQCTQTIAHRHAPRAAAGIARLEFALTIVVVVTIAAFVLDHLAELQVSARGAELETKAAQARSLAALAQAHGSAANPASASPPCPITPTRTAQSGAPSGVQTLSSCP